MPSIGPVMKELAKKGADGDAKGKKSAAGKKDNKEAPKEKPKRKGPLDALPTGTEDWATYDAPDEALEAFAQMETEGDGSCGPQGLHGKSITRPPLTLHFLHELTDLLRQCGCAQLALPALALGDLLTRGVAQCRPANVLLQLKSLDICIEMNLQAGVAFHQRAAGNVFINDEEQAKMRETIAQWREKQAQFRKEEQRMQEHLASRSSRTREGRRSRPTAGSERRAEHLGRPVGPPRLHEIWLASARLLLHQSQNRAARQLLHEAHMAAVQLQDPELQANCLLTLGQLAFAEAQFGQAVKCAREAQDLFYGDEVFWCDSSLLIANALAADCSVRTGRKMARAELVSALRVFRALPGQRQNKAGLLNLCAARLEARLGELQAEAALESQGPRPGLRATSERALLSAASKLQAASLRLLSEGSTRSAAEVGRKLATLYEELSERQTEPSRRHASLLEAVGAARRAVEISEGALRDALTVSSLQDLRNVTSALHRETAEAKVEFARLLLLAFRHFETEERAFRQRQRQKGEVLLAVEAFVSETPELSDTEFAWQELSKTAVDTAFTALTDAMSLAGSIPRYRAKCLCLFGLGFRLKALHVHPDPPIQWEANEMLAARIAQPPQESKEAAESPEAGPEGEEEEEEEEPPAKLMKRRREAAEAKQQHEAANQLFAQASEVLGQALLLALAKGLLEVARDASQQLLELFGQFDVDMAAQWLALYQSCCCGLRMRELLCAAQTDPGVSQQAALLRQRLLLEADTVTTNLADSPFMNCILEQLNRTSFAWKLSSVAASPLDLQKDLPGFLQLLILQHAHDHTCLYAGIFDKPKHAPAGRAKQAAIQPPSRTLVVRLASSPGLTRDLSMAWTAHKSEVGTLLLKHEYQRSQLAGRQRMLEKVQSAGTTPSRGPATPANPQSEALATEMSMDIDKLQSDFARLLGDLAAYLEPVLSRFRAIHRAPTAGSSSTAAKKRNAPEAEPEPSDYLALLTDPLLAEFPLEALPQLQADSVCSMSRDFSLQLLHHRLTGHGAPPEEEEGEKKKDKSDKNKPPPRIPGLRDASKKQAKIIPLNRQVPAGIQPLDTNGFRFIVDPYEQSADTELWPPIAKFQEMIDRPERAQQFTARWLGICGSDHAPSIGEYEVYLREGSSFLYVGMERFLAQLPPYKIVNLNLHDCQLIGLFDLAQTSSSFLQQSKIDVIKNTADLKLEKPVETALLLTMAGVKTIVMKQWHVTLKENCEQLDAMLGDILEGGKTLGQSVTLLQLPHRRPKPPEEEKEAEEVKEETEEGKEEKAEKEEKEEDSNRVEAKEEKDEITRDRFSTVLYGLPNQMVTLLS